MRIGILLGALIWAIIGCTAVVWSTDVRLEVDKKQGLVVTGDEQAEAQTDKKKGAETTPQVD